MLAVNAYMPNYVVVTRQNEDNVGFIETFNAESGGGAVLASNISFSFKWPYIQMNTNTNTDKVYALTIPDDNIPRLYELSSGAYSLTQTGLWTIEDGTIIFDLQSSEQKDTLFGIKVTGQYQRTLSGIQLLENNEVKITELYDLPEYWYVNASSYNGAADVYYALINNFPGREESTLEQQILIVDFADCEVGSATPKPEANLVTVKNGNFGQLQFIAYYERYLFGAGINLDNNIAFVTVVDQATGDLADINFQKEGITEVGPLVTHSNHGTTGYHMTLFVKRGGGGWVQYYLTYNSNSQTINVVQEEREYQGTEYKYFAAGTVAFNEY